MVCEKHSRAVLRKGAATKQANLQRHLHRAGQNYKRERSKNIQTFGRTSAVNHFAWRYL